MVYIIKGRTFSHKGHINQLRPRYVETVKNRELPMEVLYDTFQIEPPNNKELSREVSVTTKTSHSPKSKNSQMQTVRIERRKRTARFGSS